VHPEIALVAYPITLVVTGLLATGNSWKVGEASWLIGRVAVLLALSPSEGERDSVMTTYIFLIGQAIDEVLESHSVDSLYFDFRRWNRF